MKTMTAEQMAWNIRKGYAWFEDIDQDWRMPIWTKDGGWMWNAMEQRYELNG